MELTILIKPVKSPAQMRSTRSGGHRRPRVRNTAQPTPAHWRRTRRANLGGDPGACTIFPYTRTRRRPIEMRSGFGIFTGSGTKTDELRSAIDAKRMWCADCVVVLRSHLCPSAARATGIIPESSLTIALEHLTLARAQELALERNWDLLAAAAGVDAATAQKIVSHEFPNPTFSWATTLINVDNHPSSTSSGNGLWDRSYDTVFAVNQLFEIGGKRRNRQRSAQAGYKETTAQSWTRKGLLTLAWRGPTSPLLKPRRMSTSFRSRPTPCGKRLTLPKSGLRPGDLQRG